MVVRAWPIRQASKLWHGQALVAWQGKVCPYRERYKHTSNNNISFYIQRRVLCIEGLLSITSYLRIALMLFHCRCICCSPPESVPSCKLRFSSPPQVSGNFFIYLLKTLHTHTHATLPHTHSLTDLSLLYNTCYFVIIYICSGVSDFQALSNL